MIAMSGGVDSSVAAYLTQRAGFDCVGATMRLWDQTQTAESLRDAQAVADRLGMPFMAMDATAEFRQQVVEAFIRSYESGLTPNPCIVCNKHIKFDVLLQKALDAGCEYLVTGHYARIRQDPKTGRYLLHKAADSAKDQTYFLACLNQHQLCHTKLPLGELTKEQVRSIAAEQGFLNARKRDSQDICFIPDGDFASFIRQYTGKCYPCGDFLDQNGKVIGRHSGAFAYTLGQRKGLGIALGEPAYVCAKDMRNNTVTVGPNEALFATSLLAENWNWLPFPTLTEPIRVTAKARSRHTEQSATVYPLDNGNAKVVFDEPQRAMTPGQAIVLYQADMVVGCGTITEIL